MREYGQTAVCVCQHRRHEHAGTLGGFFSMPEQPCNKPDCDCEQFVDPDYSQVRESRCEKCGGDHGGYEDGTLGAMTRCIRGQAQLLGTGGDALIAKLDTFEREQQDRLIAALRKAEFDV